MPEKLDYSKEIDYIEKYEEVVMDTEITSKKEIKITTEEIIKDLLKSKDKKIMFIGNGASCSMASHFAVDFNKNGGYETIHTDSGTLLSCYGNDYGFDLVYSSMVGNRLNKNDWLIAISSSGNSQNIVNACMKAQIKGCKILTLSGFKKDNKIRKLGNYNLYVPAETYGMVESAHAFWLHYILDRILEEQNEKSN